MALAEKISIALSHVNFQPDYGFPHLFIPQKPVGVCQS
jgi:hypothetical protein